MASGVYQIFPTECMKKTVDMVNDTVRAMLLNNSHSYNSDHTLKTDVNANEISGTGYSANGAALASKAVTADNTDNEAVFDAADSTWTSSSFTAYHCVLFDDTLTSPADMVVASFDFGGAQTVTSGTFTIQWAAEGIINITV